jgi:hypothetical protein
LSIQRFEKDLFSLDFEQIRDTLPYLKKKYGEFLDIFDYKVVRIGSTDNPSYPDLLKGFITDYYMYEDYMKVSKTFPNLNDLQTTLTRSFKLFKYYFPKMSVPRIFTYVSGFNQSIITTDTILGISLDKYLGQSCEFYSKLELPLYLRYNMNKNKIAPDCIRAWGITQFEMSDSASNLLSNMIYQGKILYFTKALMPDEQDSLIIGFSKAQFDWCRKNEKNMWTYLVENKQLFVSDYLTISKYINEGPFTKDFSRQSPARAAIWVGWQIVNKYMDRNPDITLSELMKENNYQKILKLSKYRP